MKRGEEVMRSKNMEAGVKHVLQRIKKSTEMGKEQFVKLQMSLYTMPHTTQQTATIA